ncbi:LysR family transcriptional regulator [Streptomyces sp. NPDC047002]|uniref:LysR family transcriptional regulator n=1 Tax=Streptomyces sp. NPDC047002 TaxID=3155475 RepID=UPI0034513F29
MPDPSPDPVDLDLRLVHCFTVVAEHRHFGRAADALHLTQPALSRQIRRLERQLACRLFDRSPRGTTLTAAGDAFLPLARELLRHGATAVARTRAAALPTGITIGYTTNLVVTDAVGELRRRRPDACVHTLHLRWDATRDALLGHRVDAAVARLPLRPEGLSLTVLREEARVLVVASGHRLAGRASVTLDDIADEPLPRSTDPYLDAFWRIDPRPDGRPAPGGPLVEALEDKTEAVAAGEAVAIVPAGEHLDRMRPGLTAVPLEGAEPSRVVLATRAGDRTPLVAAFREIAGTYLADPAGPGPR